MYTGLLITERATARRSELLDDARTARRAHRARATTHVVRVAPPRPATLRRGWPRSATQPQSE